MNIPRQHVIALRAGIEDLFEGTRLRIGIEGRRPRDDSPACRQIRRAASPNSVKTAISITELMVEHSADHSACFHRLSDPTHQIPNISLMTCVRSMLETASLAVWVGDPAISCDERTQRVIAYRIGGLVEQRKCANSASAAPSELQRIEDRIDVVAKEAQTHGLALRLKGGTGKLEGVSPGRPNASQIIRDYLGMETEYRMLSAIAHGQTWALQQLAFSRVENTQNGANIERAMSDELLAFLGRTTSVSFCNAFGSYSQFLGWPPNPITSQFKSVFQKLSLNETNWFWK